MTQFTLHCITENGNIIEISNADRLMLFFSTGALIRHEALNGNETVWVRSASPKDDELNTYVALLTDTLRVTTRSN